jgi:hypothetical protein
MSFSDLLSDGGGAMCCRDLASRHIATLQAAGDGVVARSHIRNATKNSFMKFLLLLIDSNFGLNEYR